MLFTNVILVSFKLPTVSFVPQMASGKNIEPVWSGLLPLEIFVVSE
jgi:hypothetical protein